MVKNTKDYFLDKSKEINRVLKGLFSANPPSSLINEKLLIILEKIFKDGYESRRNN